MVLISLSWGSQSLHTKGKNGHFIPVHYIPWGTSYQSHFLPYSLHTSDFIPVTSYSCISYHVHFTFLHFIQRVTWSDSLHIGIRRDRKNNWKKTWNLNVSLQLEIPADVTALQKFIIKSNVRSTIKCKYDWNYTISVQSIWSY